jgi:hypothetical protein
VKALRCLAAAALLLAQGGCTTLKSFSLTQVPADRSHRIEASASSGGLFGIFFSNDFVDELTADLTQQCPNGRVTGVLTKQESTLYVIWVSRKLTATAYCLPAAPPSFSSPGLPAAPHPGPAAPPPPGPAVPPPPGPAVPPAAPLPPPGPAAPLPPPATAPAPRAP